MRAAIYARYSSENQRPESIEDQISACRRLASERGYTVEQAQIYSDMASSGARRDRPELTRLLSQSEDGSFEVVLVDDLSRLARDNFLMLSILVKKYWKYIHVLHIIYLL